MGWMLSRFIDEALHDFEAQYPTLCETIPLQRSSPGNKPITAMRITDPGLQDRIPVLVTGGVHAREWAPPDSLVRFAERLLVARANEVDIVYSPFTSGGVTYGDPDYRISRAEVLDIFDRFELIVLPLVNPDGRDFSLLGTTHDQQWWRKNRRDLRDADEQDLPATCVGVDLNRNYPIAWDHIRFYRPDAADKDDVSVSKCNFQTYKGPSAGSEIETQNVITLARTHAVEAFVDVHMAGRTISYPWAFERNQTTVEEMRFFDADYHHLVGDPNTGRDGQLGDKYGEYVPPELLQRLETVANAMSREILQSAGASPVAKLRSTYATMQTVDTAKDNGFDPATTFTGGADDYIFSLQFTDETMPECVSFTLEVGLDPGQRKDNPRESDGGFFPHFDKQLPKIEREIHAALFGLLRALGE